MKDLLGHFTLFDFVGILIPGSVALGALGVLASSLDCSFEFGPPRNSWEAVVYLLLAYVLGTVVASLGCQVLPRQIRIHFGSRPLRRSLVEKVRVAVAPKEPDMPQIEVLRELDGRQITYPLQQIYVARQGYYRGMAVVSGLNALVAILALLASAHNPLPRVSGFVLGRAWLEVMGLAGALLYWVFRDRYYYFVQWEIIGALAAFPGSPPVEAAGPDGG